jgi:hypothetical protein
MTGKSKVALKNHIFIEDCNKATYENKIITRLCLITKAAKR